MFIPLLALTGLTFTGTVNNSPITVQKENVYEQTTHMGGSLSAGVFVYERVNLTGSGNITFNLSYQGQTYEAINMNYSASSNYVNIQVGVPLDSNLQYSIYWAYNDDESEDSNFYFPEFQNQDEEPLFFHYFGDWTGTRLNYTINWADSYEPYDNFNFGILIHSLDESTYDRLNPNYSENYLNGYDTGYADGYTNGSADGYDTGYYNGQQAGYQNGYNDGFEDADTQDTTALTIFTGIINVALLPVNVFLQILNFEVFGINIGGLVSAFLTIAIVIILWRIIKGNKND